MVCKIMPDFMRKEVISYGKRLRKKIEVTLASKQNK